MEGVRLGSGVGVVMGGIENFLSQLLKDKIPWYHGILPCSDFTY